jgi:hypothetical protein
MRKHGNPELEKFKFKPKGPEPYNARVAFWTTPSAKARLDKIERKNDFLRSALNRALDEFESMNPE